MRFLVRLFITVFFVDIGFGTFAQSSEASMRSPKGDLELEFERVISNVKDQLLNAPDASEVYLAYWIAIYKEALATADTIGLDFPERDLRIKNQERRVETKDLFHDKQYQGSWKPNGYPIVAPEWAAKKPIRLRSPDQFRPLPPPGPQNVSFQDALREVRIYGDLYSSVRTAEQSLVAAFWANGTGTETPPGRWNIIALEASRYLPRRERIQLLLNLNIALYDAGIAAWDAKYHYNYWRPQSAISSTFHEYAEWEPMMQPPFHPEYVSGHSAFSGAAAEVLEHYLGTPDFCILAEELSGLTRCYNSFDEAAIEAGQSRVYGGIHFQFSNEAGLELGRNVARHLISNPF